MEYIVSSILGAAALVFLVLFLRAYKSSHSQSSRREELERELLLARQKVKQLEDQQVTFAQEKREISYQVEELRQRLSRSDQRLIQLESEEQQRKRDVEQRIRELDGARRSLEQERERVISEERIKIELEAANRDRQWAMHEQESVKLLRELSGRGDLYFPSFDNTDLPEGFDRSLKPDFLIRFLDQYVIFDAKLSKSQNLQAYLSQQSKQTARKISGSAERDMIFPVLFFVVPSMDIGTLKFVSYYEEGYQFYCISPEAVEPILSLFKRLEGYEFAEACNPQEREQIVQVIASLEHHIRHQNAVHVLSVLRGVQALEMKDILDDRMNQAVVEKRKSIRIENFSPSSLRRFIQDDHALRDEILRILTPRPASVDQDDLDGAQQHTVEGCSCTGE